MAQTATTSDLITKRQHYELLWSKLSLERSTFIDHWRDLADYIMPRRQRFTITDRNKGDRRNQRIIDSTATFAARTLRSGLHAGITSPARPWMRLTTPDPDLAEFGPVKEWLHTVTQRVLTVFLRSNVYNALPVIYGDMGVFATSAMSVLNDGKKFMRCYPYPIGSYVLGVSNRQVVDTFMREYQMTVRQLVAEFGIDSISNAARTLYDRGEYEQTVDVYWVVTPNSDADSSKLTAKYLPWASCWYEKATGGAEFLRESGFEEFPILAPRWDVQAEDIYGTQCPGMDCLGDIRALQMMQKRKAQAVEKKINPPLQGPAHLRAQKISLLPGDFTAVDAIQQQLGIRPIHEVNQGIEELTFDIQDTRMMINRAFFVDLFLMLASSPSQDTQKTAREIDERHEEKLLAVGPVLERTNDELLDPLVDRVYGMMERAGMIPEPPTELDGVDLKVEYISIMAQAQKLVGAVGLDRFVASTVPLLEAFPEIRHKIRAPQLVDDYGDILGINPKVIVPDDEAAAAYQAEQQAAAAQAQAERTATVAKGVRDLGQTDLQKDSALRRLVEGVTP